MRIRFDDFARILMFVFLPLLCRGCNTNYQISLSEGSTFIYVESPNYPSYYPNNAWVCWTITSTSYYRPRVYLQENVFSLEYGSSGCPFDYLLVTDSSAGMSWKYCGSSAFGTLYTQGPTVNLEFRTDGSNAYQGFQIYVQITDQLVSSNEPSFTSPTGTPTISEQRPETTTTPAKTTVSTQTTDYIATSGAQVPSTTIDPPPTLGYRMSQSGSFRSSTGQSFTQSCIMTYSSDFNDQAYSMIQQVNGRIGSTICTDKTEQLISIFTVATTFSTSTSTGTTGQFWTLKVGQEQQLGGVEGCATEIAGYLANHQNWPDPILSQEPGCPAVVFTPEYFNTTGYEWVCPATTEVNNYAEMNLVEIPDINSGSNVPIKPVDASVDEIAFITNRTHYTDLLKYNIVHLGYVYSETGESISAQCQNEYVLELQDSTYQQITQTNQMIGSSLCSGLNIQISSGRTSFTASGSQAMTRQIYTLNPGVDLYFSQVYACADEVSAYLQPHYNWAQPILPKVSGCPNMIFNPQSFSEDSQSWTCA